MNAAAVAGAAHKIADLEAALRWMRDHGKDALNPKCEQAFGISVSLNHASACAGAHEARVHLSAQARLFGHEILAAAIKDAENTIEIYKQQIADELTR